MKELLLFTMLCASELFAKAQNTFPTSGNVGIGTTSPLSELHVAGLAIVSNPSGSNYNENLRLPPAGDDYSSIALGAVPGTYGSGNGQWSLIRYPAAQNNMFSIRHNSTDYFNILNNGKIGINTQTPVSRLDVEGSTATEFIRVQSNATGTAGYLDMYSSAQNGFNASTVGFNTNGAPLVFNIGGAERMRVVNDGNIGIGTQSPASRLDVEGSTATEYIRIQSNASGSGGFLDMYSSATNGFNASTVGFNTNGNALVFNINGSEKLRALSNGNVGIGTTAPDQKLSVAGTIHSQVVKVDMSGWSDYVFKPTYNLSSLENLKAYIDKNHHLPDMPSEKEVIKNGVDIGKMLKLQQKKIEELTLYLIENEKRDEKSRMEIKNLQKEITKLKNLHR